jgi:hypothetical protein
MTKQELKRTLIGIIILAFLSQGLWLFEMTSIVGWENSEWVTRFLFTPFVICFLAAGAYLMPFMVKHGSIDAKVSLTFGSFFFLNITCYILGEMVLKFLYNPSVATLPQSSITLYRLLGISTIGIFAYGYFYLTQQLVTPVNKRQILLFITAIGFMFFMGFLTTFLLKKGIVLRNIIGAVKMGAVQFWIGILLGLIGIVSVKWLSKE